GLAAALMVAVSPDVLWSVSFQLSFAAMAGIALFAEPLDRLIQSLAARHLAPLRFISSMTAMTIAATFATLPLVAFYFLQVSLVGLLTTLLALPALPFALVAQAAAGLAGLVFAPLASALGWLAWALTAYVTGVVSAVAELPSAAVETGRLAPLLLWLYYALLILPFLSRPLRRALQRWTASMPRPGPVANLGIPMLALVPAVSIAALVWTAALSGPDSRLHVVFADVGQGDGIFISTPGGHQILVDGGPDPQKFVSFLGGRMPFRDRNIELMVLTHAHSDHVTGLLETLNRYDVERVLERQVDYDGPPYLAWRKALESAGAQVIQAQVGQTIAFGDGVFIQVVSPPERLLRGTASDVDNASVVLRLIYGEVSFLLTGDLFAEGERALVAQNAPIDADVLKVGHHGSSSSSTAAFLKRVSPSIAVVSVGEDNSFGHPHPEAIAALQAYVPPELLFITADRGAVEFITDGKRIEVKAER
ncbi:MAG: ComEC/Rec2 family competence protein, partial [Chloroflexi bacterium]|nr:ComEC/Rec2 family competence protein [Chloroflexota bacterium]